MPLYALDPKIHRTCAEIEGPISLEGAWQGFNGAPFRVVGVLGLFGEVVLVTIVPTIKNDGQEL